MKQARHLAKSNARVVKRMRCGAHDCGQSRCNLTPALSASQAPNSKKQVLPASCPVPQLTVLCCSSQCCAGAPKMPAIQVKSCSLRRLLMHTRPQYKITIIPVTPRPHILATQLFKRSSDGWRCSSRWRLYRATHLELHKNNKTRAVHQAPKPRSHSRISAPSRWRRPAIMLQSVTR